MDLSERIRERINQLSLPVKCLAGYLDGKHNPDLRLQVLPGSQVIERDYAGNKTEQYVLEVIMRGEDEAVIAQTLGTVAECLGSNDFQVVSKDNSFVFTQLKIASFPHPILADTAGKVTYVFDFKVIVDTFDRKD